MTRDDLERIQAFLPAPVRTAPAGATRKPVTPEHTAPSLTFMADVGVAIGQVDRMYQEIRQDFLEARGLDRTKLLESRTFALPSAWKAVRAQLADALADPEVRVIIMVAPRGYGSTTFVHHVLAHHTPFETKLVELEPDGPRPKVSRIRRERGRAYQLDLKDPHTDHPSTTFLDDLAASVPVLKQVSSTWVLNIAADLWTEQRTWPVAPGVRVVELRSPPEPFAVAERHLTAAGMPWLVPYLRSDTARVHLSSLRNAVEAVRAAGAVAEQWLEFKRDHSEEASWIEEGKLGRPDEAGDNACHPELRTSVENALGDWRTELDGVFAHGGDTGGALSLPDRCLLLSLALHRVAPAAKISRDARALEDLIAKKDRTHAPTNLGQVFAGRGLRQRLTALHATVSSQDIAALSRPGYAQAVLTYVWDNYEDMRSVLLEWLISTAPAERAEADKSISALTTLAARHQAPTVLTEIRDTAHESGRSDMCAAVMTRVLKDVGMERAAWARLYDWADDRRLATQSVVVDVAEHVLTAEDPGGRDHRKAMTRLRRVASTSKDQSLLAGVLAVFHRLGHREEGRNLLLSEVLRWREKKARRSGKIALLGLMAQFDGPRPWLLGTANEKARTEIDEGLRDLLADPQFEPQAVPAICAWFKTAATDTAAYAAVRNCVVPALGGQSSRDAGIDLFHQVGRLLLPDGTQVGDDLWASLVRLRRS
ncbi:hypothetical protein [Kitasatospora sp. NPDC057738]|uniref:hypothetical protein n=2 Tax=unclassified Kitasatospora TaxID=2633591 RepID=UPI0036C60645